MKTETQLLWLRVVMVATGAFLVILLPFMFDLWPSGFRWAHPSMHPAYERMIIAIYFSLGICLLVAARDPQRHAILIDPPERDYSRQSTNQLSMGFPSRVARPMDTCVDTPRMKSRVR